MQFNSLSQGPLTAYWSVNRQRLRRFHNEDCIIVLLYGTLTPGSSYLILMMSLVTLALLMGNFFYLGVNIIDHFQPLGYPIRAVLKCANIAVLNVVCCNIKMCLKVNIGVPHVVCCKNHNVLPGPYCSAKCGMLQHQNVLPGLHCSAKCGILQHHSVLPGPYCSAKCGMLQYHNVLPGLHCSAKCGIFQYHNVLPGQQYSAKCGILHNMLQSMLPRFFYTNVSVWKTVAENCMICGHGKLECVH